MPVLPCCVRDLAAAAFEAEDMLLGPGTRWSSVVHLNPVLVDSRSAAGHPPSHVLARVGHDVTVRFKHASRASDWRR